MRLIDADALKKTLKNIKAKSPNPKYQQGLQDAIDGFFPQIIDDAPTIDAEPVKHGRWKEKLTVIYCSCCHLSWSKCFSESLRRTYKYCPNCGAKMDGGERKQ